MSLRKSYHFFLSVVISVRYAVNCTPVPLLFSSSEISMMGIRFSVQQWFLCRSFVSLVVTLAVSVCFGWHSLERPRRKLVLLYFVFKEHRTIQSPVLSRNFLVQSFRCMKFTICNFCNILFSMADTDWCLVLLISVFHCVVITMRYCALYSRDGLFFKETYLQDSSPMNQSYVRGVDTLHYTLTYL